MDRNPAIWAAAMFFLGLGVQMSGLVNMYVAYFCFLLSAILALYATKKHWLRWIVHPAIQQPATVVDKKSQLQELYNKLDKIGKSKILDNQSVMDEIDNLNEWKDEAKRLIIKLYDKNELAIFINRINLVEKKYEYQNYEIGRIKAFYNEKNLYLAYLMNLLND